MSRTLVSVPFQISSLRQPVDPDVLIMLFDHAGRGLVILRQRPAVRIQQPRTCGVVESDEFIQAWPRIDKHMRTRLCGAALKQIAVDGVRKRASAAQTGQVTSMGPVRTRSPAARTREASESTPVESSRTDRSQRAVPGRAIGDTARTGRGDARRDEPVDSQKRADRAGVMR